MAEITKLWIADKMKELMKQKPIDKIRVTEICKAAEIERPTFYYHFKDKYDLVAWIFFQSANKTDVVSVKSAAEGMKMMKQDFIFYKRAYEDSSQNALWAYMLEYFVCRYEKNRKGKAAYRCARYTAQIQYSSLLLRFRGYDKGVALIRQHHLRRGSGRDDVQFDAKRFV